MIRTFKLLLLLGILTSYAHAQNVPLGEWESQFSYRSAQHIVAAGQKVFCSSYNGLFSINPADDKIIVYSKANGLNDVGISSMSYDSTQQLLLLAYRNGNLDLVYLNEHSEPDEIVNLSFLTNSQDLPADKKINKILFRKNIAYLSTAFGILVLNPKLREVVETYRYIGAQGAEVQIRDIAFSNDSLFAVTSEGLSAVSLNTNINRQDFSNWKTITTPFKPTSVSFQNTDLYIGISGKGVYKRNNGIWQSIFSSGSTIVSFSDKLITLSDKILDISKEKPDVYENPAFLSLRETFYRNKSFWSADVKNGLLSNKSGAFRLYGPLQGDTTIVTKTDSSVTDLNGLLWTRLPSYLGGGISVKNSVTNQQRIFSTSIGNGGLPSPIINSLALDAEGLMWFASEKGVGYFITDDVLTVSRQDAILPVYGQRKLFSNERCNAIAVEPGNRKWIGTNKGLFQFTADGTELIQEFTSANSPLPSSQINDLLYTKETGILFVDTPNGMVSYRSDATTPGENFSGVTIFPNPVRPEFEGNLGVKGLMENSVVKVTDLTGRLVYETRSQGGTASWNLNDYTGKRARSGIYLIIIVSADRSEKTAGKLAIIN